MTGSGSLSMGLTEGSMPSNFEGTLDATHGRAGAVAVTPEKTMLGVSAPTAQPNNGSTAKSKSSATIDPVTQDAAERLRTGRLGYRFCKRAFDIVFSLLVLVGFCWLYAIVAVVIKLDDPHGPVVFKQTRVGKDGREFQMYKFRSMVADAETRLAQLLERNEKTGPVFKLHDDPRLTRVGRVIRKISLDELPQFVNVLKGDLSVVGPRPALPREVATYDDRQRQRLLVKQGLTCYWQTRRDRDSITFDKWVDLDLLYIRKCSAWTDFKLIVQTVGCVLTAQGH